ncbi:MAG: hypothetical protein ACE5KU_02655 [Nitrososphaerales archaeon]
MTERKKTFPLFVIILISLILFGNVGLSYLVSLLVGTAELQVGYLVASLLIFGGSIFLILRIIYQIDRRGSRLKRRIGWFEPVEEDE